MPKTGTLIIALIALLLLPLVPFAQTPGIKEYKIVKGDTLWDISKGELDDPFLWPEVWKENPSIANPDRIYPDQIIKIPLYLIQQGEKAEENAVTSTVTIKQPVNAPAQVSKGVKKEEAAPAPSATPAPPAAIAAKPRYKDLKGIVLYDGQIIYGQIIQLSADMVTIRKEDAEVASYSFVQEVQNFIKE